MARQIQVVGMAKTGTMHIAALYKKLFPANGIDGITQHQCPLNKLSPDINFIDAFWESSTRIQALSERYPYLRFIILYRDVEKNCSSLHNFYTDRRHPHKDLLPEEYVKLYWRKIYKSISDQLPSINPKPFFMLSKDYFSGKHNKLLLDMFALPATEKNFNIINKHLKYPVNRSKHKIVFELNEKTRNDCALIGNEIAERCADSWIWTEL